LNTEIEKKSPEKVFHEVAIKREIGKNLRLHYNHSKLNTEIEKYYDTDIESKIAGKNGMYSKTFKGKDSYQFKNSRRFERSHEIESKCQRE